MSALALVLARAGSKGLPGKNIRPVAGRPCIAWSIAAARRAELVDRVIVSTDGEEIAGVACACGVEVAMRPAELASDRATVDEAARHAVRAMGDHAPEHVVLLYGNVPVRPEGLIDEALRLLTESGCDSVQSYAPVGKHHPWWTAVVGETGAVRPWEGDVLNHGVFRRQDLPPAHVPDGGVIALTRRALMLEVSGVEPGPHAFFGGDRRGVVTAEGAVVDIDTEIDLLVAYAILSRHAPAARASAG